MRYRREDDDGDYTFGQGDDTWLVNSPEAVAQAIKTRFLALVRSVVPRYHRGNALDSVSPRQTTTRYLQPGYPPAHPGNAGRELYHRI